MVQPRVETGPSANWAFVVLVFANYILIFASGTTLWSPAAVPLLVAGVLYGTLGVYGRSYCERARNPWITALYFIVQMSLTTFVLYTSKGAGWLLGLPLAAHGVVLLTGWWRYVTGALIAAVIVFVFYRLGAAPNALQEAAVGILAATLFVVVFTQIAVAETAARAEVERLARELQTANEQLRTYAAQVEELATTKERNRLAREIHDSLGHYLTVINVQLGAARAVLERDPARALDAINKAQTLSQEGLADVRRSVAALRMSPTESRSLIDALDELKTESCAAGVQTTLTVDGEARPLSAQAELTLYRTAQEGLTNVRKHAAATQARLSVDFRDLQRVSLVVQDNGVGSGSPNGGYGLLGICERVKLLGGDCQIETAPNQGFRLAISLPG